jgi:hypothetical protein
MDSKKSVPIGEIRKISTSIRIAMYPKVERKMKQLKKNPQNPS